VAFYSPELLTADEMALFKAYLRDKWSAPDANETEWMTLEKAEAALRDLRAAGVAEHRELNAIASFLCARCAGGA
jgi:exodeoxyribonuclease-1